MSSPSVLNNSFNQSQTTYYTAGLLSAELRDIFDLIGFDIIWPGLLIIGVFTNCLNLTIFIRMGLVDGVTIAFFSLSVSDFCQILLSLFTWVCMNISSATFLWTVHPYHLAILVTWYSSLFLNISILITTYISVQRACCVVFPFHFKGVFTRNRTYIIMFVVYSFSTAWYMPIFTKQGLAPYTERGTNWTYLALAGAADRGEYVGFYDFANRVVVPTTAEIIVVLCLCVFSRALYSSVEFRRAASADAKSPQDAEGKGRIKRKVVDSKETQVVKAVTIVSIAFVVCNSPAIALAFTRQFFPPFGLYEAYTDLYVLLQMINHLMELFNASLNAAIYLKYNSKYRKIFMAMRFVPSRLRVKSVE